MEEAPNKNLTDVPKKKEPKIKIFFKKIFDGWGWKEFIVLGVIVAGVIGTSILQPIALLTTAMSSAFIMFLLRSTHKEEKPKQNSTTTTTTTTTTKTITPSSITSTVTTTTTTTQ